MELIEFTAESIRGIMDKSLPTFSEIVSRVEDSAVKGEYHIQLEPHHHLKRELRTELIDRGFNVLYHKPTGRKDYIWEISWF